MTRAWILAFQFKFSQALKMHPLFWSVIIVVILGFLSIVYKKYQKVYTLIGILIVVAFISLYVYRMIVYFPNEAPLDYNSNNIIANVYRFLVNLKK
jgi:tellurite resistance protein TehA-like permease